MGASWGLLGAFHGLLGCSWSPLPSPSGLVGAKAGSPFISFHFFFRFQSSLKLSHFSLFLFLFVLRLGSFWVPLLDTFCCLLGSQIGPKSAQDRPKSPLDTLFVSNKCFFTKCSFAPFYDPKTTPRRPPRRPKMGSRRVQDGLEELLFSSSFLSSILFCFGSRLGCHVGSLWVP